MIPDFPKNNFSTMHKIILCSLLTLSAHAADSVFVEAEAFSDKGGWSTDSQFILNMGSAYLIAHGLGTPVADAKTEVTFPSAGTYHLHVRTKDWVGPWKAEGAPGKFQVLVNGKAVDTTFGTTGSEWHWQDGGKVEISDTKTSLSIKDLAGFNGRCDAIFFSKDGAETPPNDAEALFKFRRAKLNLPATPPTKDGYDLVVVGGGYSGIGAAISGARQGLKVALIHDRSILGGNGSSEVQVWAMGSTKRGKFPHLGEIIEEFTDYSRDSPGLIEEFQDDLKTQVVKDEKNIDLYLEHFAYKTNTKGDKIVSVDVVDTTSGEFVRIAGNLFADTTGHGTIGAQAGANFMMAEKGHMGMSNMWSYNNSDNPVAWPETPWALPLEEEHFPKLHLSRGPYEKFHKAEWFWEGGYDKHPINDLELIRDWNLRANFGAFTNIKKNKANANAKLMWMAYIGGNRESRRLEGDIILTGEDITARKDFPDGTAPTTWSIDLHYPKKEYLKGPAKDNPFISIAVHDRKVDRQNGYPIPYRTMYSKNIDNLFMAGRCISVDRRALGTIRVMRTCGMMGEVVGKAAWIATNNKTNPRGVYANYLPQLIELMETPGRARRASLNGDLVVPPLPEGGLRTRPKKKLVINLKGIVVDDTKAKFTGTWLHSEGLKPHIGNGYHYASGDASALFQFRIKNTGKYEVRFYWQPHHARTKAAQAEITHAGGKDTVMLDLTKKPAQGQYQVLGTYEFNDVLKGSVVFTNKSSGLLHVDAVQVMKK